MILNAQRTVRTLVVDDHAVVRLGMRSLLVAQDWVEECFTADGLATAVAAAEQRKPDLAVIDLFVGEESGLAICRRLKQINPHLLVVLMSGVGDTCRPVFLSAGASAFISKSATPSVILDSLQRVVSERGALETAPTQVADPLLTARQLDVLRQLATGASNTEAAGTLAMSPHTVKQHTQAIYQRLGVRNRAEAVGLGQRIGLIG